jgi:Type II secretion system (T2SS), protein M
MTGRDRIVLMAIVVLVLLGGGYVMVVSPERKQAAEAQTSVQTAKGQLESAEQTAASARAAQRRYSAAYSSVVSLGKAVPPADEVPSLIYELEQASNQREVDFNSISSAANGGSGAAGASATTAATTAESGGFTQMPFTFIFKGSFAGLAHLFNQVEGFAVRTNTGGLAVSGRLLTIQGVTITPESGGSAGDKATGGAGSSTSSGALTATVTATAYVLPATQGLTGGASPSAPGAAGATTTASAGSTGSSNPATPAVVKATP